MIDPMSVYEYLLGVAAMRAELTARAEAAEAERDALRATVARVRALAFVSELEYEDPDEANDSWDEALALARLDVLRALDGGDDE